MSIKNLKADLKEIFAMKRAPKDIRTFDVMRHVYDMHRNDLKCERDIFISTKHLKNMNINQNVSKQYFDTFVEWDNNEYTYTKGLCRTIKCFTQPFVDLYNKYKELPISDVVVKSYSHSTEAIKDNLSELNAASNKAFGEDTRDYYTSTPNSPFRKYHPLQNTKRADREWLFEGKWDVDITSCNGSIAWHELDLVNSNNPMAYLLNPEFSDILLNMLQDAFKCDRVKAKEYRCILTSDYKTLYGVKWFDDLHIEINKRAWRKFGTVMHKGKEVKIDTLHKYFTYVEQNIMEGVSSMCDEVLRIHDGLISNTKPNKNYVEYNGNRYTLKVKQMGEA